MFSPPPSRGRLGGGWGPKARIVDQVVEPHPRPVPPLEGEETLRSGMWAEVRTLRSLFYDYSIVDLTLALGSSLRSLRSSAP